MSIACFAVENRKDPAEIDDMCGVYGYSRYLSVLVKFL